MSAQWTVAELKRISTIIRSGAADDIHTTLHNAIDDLRDALDERCGPVMDQHEQQQGD